MDGVKKLAGTFYLLYNFSMKFAQKQSFSRIFKALTLKLDKTAARGLPGRHAGTLAASLLLVLALCMGSSAGNGLMRVEIKAGPGSAPEGWQLKEWHGHAEFSVVAEGSDTAIHMKSDHASGAIYKDIEFDIKDYPMLHWKWKAVKLPEGADVRVKSKDDQAVQVYVLFPRWPAIINGRVLGYIWDTSAPAGSFIQSTKSSNTRYVVIRSGNDGVGQWFTEQRNVYEDYKKSFGEEPPPVGSVSVMIDSDDMRTTAESYVRDIYFSKQPGSGTRQQNP